RRHDRGGGRQGCRGARGALLRNGGRRIGAPCGPGHAGRGGRAMSKALVCPCEDVTFDNLDHAVANGHSDIESIKRFTGFGTGMCQGKSCTPAVSAYLHRKGLLAPAAQAPFTARPPLQPTRLCVLASDPVPAEEPPIGGTPPAIELSV